MTERWLCGAPTGCHVLSHGRDHTGGRVPHHRCRQWRPVCECCCGAERGQADRARRRLHRAAQFDDQLHAGSRSADSHHRARSPGGALDQVACDDRRRAAQCRPTGCTATGGACRHAHDAGRDCATPSLTRVVGGDATCLHSDCHTNPRCRTASFYACPAAGFDRASGFHEHHGSAAELHPATRCTNPRGLASWQTDPADPTRMPAARAGRQRSLELR